MAGTLTITNNNATLFAKPIRKYTFAWTSDSSGNVSGTASDAISGTIVRVVTNPGATAPTDNYDVVLNDADGIDVLAGQGANRDTADSEHFCPGVAFKDGTTTSIAPVVVDGELTLGVTNAGNAKQGELHLYVR